jgi:sugar/nucleoside kinase (ribokinase family)
MPSDGQLCGMTGLSNPVDAAAAIRSGGVGTVLVTLGARGSIAVSDRGVERISALPAETLDTTGCGDAYCAGVIAGLLLGWEPRSAAWLGAGAGALVAGGLGSDAGITNLDDLVAFVSEHHPNLGA